MVKSVTENTKAFAEQSSLPQLEPGQTGELVLWVYGPIKKPGTYQVVWNIVERLNQSNTDTLTAIGPAFVCQWTVDEAVRFASYSELF